MCGQMKTDSTRFVIGFSSLRPRGGSAGEVSEWLGGQAGWGPSGKWRPFQISIAPERGMLVVAVAVY